MTSLPEQLSAARTQQLDAQFKLFSSLATQALDNASRIVSLNLATSRESAERTSRALQQMLGATDPRELAALRTHAEEQVRSLFAYGRELFSIATAAQPQVARTLAAAAPSALAASKAIEPVVERSVDAVKDTVQAASDTAARVADASANAVKKTTDAVTGSIGKTTDTVADAVDKSAAAAPTPDPVAALVQEHALKDEPAVVQSAAPQDAAPDAAPPAADPNPIAKAIGKGAPKAAAAAQPMAAPVADKEASSVTPIAGTQSKRKK